MRYSVKDRYNYLKTTLGENEILDEKTLHKLVMTSDGKVVEMKWCPECRTWHPLGDFPKSKTVKDGLGGMCKNCKYKKNKNKVRIHKSSRAVSIPFNTPIPIVEKGPECPNGNLDSIINSIREEYEKKQKEIDELKKQVVQLSTTTKDLTKLTPTDVEYVVSHYDIAPRVLFNAIRRQTSQYVFYAYDTVSGAKIPIKEEMSA